MLTIPENWAIYIDLGVIVFYLIFLIAGAKKGFLLQVVSVAGTVLSFYAAWRLCKVLAEYFRLWPRAWAPLQDTVMADAVYQYINEICWFLLSFLVLRLLFQLLEPLARGLQRIPVIKQVSWLLGGIFGLIAATIWILIICILLNTPMFSNGSQIADMTYIGAISDKTSQVVTSLGVPVNDSKAFSSLFHDAQNLSEDDRNALRNWLDEHGYQAISESVQPSMEPTAQPQSTPTPTNSAPAADQSAAISQNAKKS